MERLNHNFADMLSMYVSADHSDWDSALPYVRFAYNTSRQKTTGRSPFFLMYGRHPVLPVDAICGADPDPAQIVSVESGGPENYEEWMLGNPQKAFDEVDGKSQAAQERQKRYYDKNHRKAEVYEEGQQLLVYRPTRKVGRAEKLLHRWHGLYVVIRQITPLNYEVQLPGVRKSDVVHVERMKKLLDLNVM